MAGQSMKVVSMLLLATVLLTPRGLAAQDSYAYSVRAVTLEGTTYTGIVTSTPPFEKLLEAGDSIDPSQVDPKQSVRLGYFNGLNGAIALRFGELKSVEVEGRLSEDDVAERRERQRSTLAARRVREVERLRIVYEARAARAAEEAREAEEAAGQQQEGLPEELQKWIDRFPPSEGWIPAKKAKLYYETVILNNRPPTEDEHAWLDSYDQWKEAYDAWFALEQDKLTEEQEAKDSGEPEPTGSDRPEPSGTSSDDGAAIDPDHPTDAARSRLPPPIDPKTAKPDKISETTPKPISLDKKAIPPSKMKDGSRP